MTLPILRSANLPIRRGENVRDTALSAFNPWREFDEMNHWFDTFMGRSFGASPFGQGAEGNTPALDLYENAEELRLVAYVPGARRESFDISVGRGVLTVKGERQPLLEGEGWTGYGSGIARSAGTFETSYSLPVEVAADQVKATYHDGVLEIRLPKAEPEEVKSVKVNIEG